MVSRGSMAFFLQKQTLDTENPVLRIRINRISESGSGTGQAKKVPENKITMKNLVLESLRV
jgi:hypothetical protein